MIDTEWFKERIAKRGLTQASFGRLLQLDRPKVTRILNGERDIHINEIVTIADILGVSVEEVVRRATKGQMKAMKGRG